jgi:hypothetical protein
MIKPIRGALKALAGNDEDQSTDYKYRRAGQETAGWQ